MLKTSYNNVQNFHEEERVLDTVFRSRKISYSDPKYDRTLAPYFQLRNPLCRIYIFLGVLVFSNVRVSIFVLFTLFHSFTGRLKKKILKDRFPHIIQIPYERTKLLVDSKNDF